MTMPTSYIGVLFLLVAAHMLADFPLQGDFLARAKSRLAGIDGVPWWYALAAHATIHGGFVFLITGNLWLGLGEILFHAAIDFGKCEGGYGQGKEAFNLDQGSHLVCKMLWAAIASPGGLW